MVLGSSSTDETVSTQVESCGCTTAFVTGWDMVWELMSNKFAAPAAGYGHFIDAHVSSSIHSLIRAPPPP